MLNFNDYHKQKMNESFLSSAINIVGLSKLNNYLKKKITAKMKAEIHKQIDSMEKEDRILFVRNVIKHYKKDVRKSNIYSTGAFIISFFTFSFMMIPILLSHEIVDYILDYKIEELNDIIKKDLNEISNNIKSTIIDEEIDKEEE